LNERVPLQLAQTVDEVWSMDFVSVFDDNYLGRLTTTMLAG
jgi:hypothetical protein